MELLTSSTGRFKFGVYFPLLCSRIDTECGVLSLRMALTAFHGDLHSWPRVGGRHLEKGHIWSYCI